MGEIGNLIDTYATKDLYFATFLSVKGIIIEKVEKYGHSNLNRASPNQKMNTPAYFIFRDKIRCEELEDIFWSGIGEEAMVNVKEFTTTLRDLRTRAFSISRVIDNIVRNYENN